jgi:hypothetical protein
MPFRFSASFLFSLLTDPVAAAAPGSGLGLREEDEEEEEDEVEAAVREDGS